ncbi:BTAD domain-containing putative transcriptional regulator [Streptomyces sp. NPDC053367]|uniref:AfsR/SARP family transcriptional regulator n=1 Tax=Streptomyces sp. NPDC053367 TaxID=3365700 RepID=UPI0037D12207
MDQGVGAPVFRILGGVRVAGGRVAGVKPRALLVALLLEVNRMVPTDRLVDTLWDAEPPVSAIANLRTHVSGLRRIVADAGALVSHPGGYELVVPEDMCDTHRFRSAAGLGRAALADGRPDAAMRHLHGALALWTADRAAADVPRHGRLATLLDFLDEEHRRTVEDFAEASLHGGEPRAALRELSGLLALDPLRTRSWALRMRAHHRLGERGGVLQAVREAAGAFREHLGAPLDEELLRLGDDLCGSGV